MTECEEGMPDQPPPETHKSLGPRIRDAIIAYGNKWKMKIACNIPGVDIPSPFRCDVERADIKVLVAPYGVQECPGIAVYQEADPGRLIGRLVCNENYNHIVLDELKSLGPGDIEVIFSAVDQTSWLEEIGKQRRRNVVKGQQDFRDWLLQQTCDKRDAATWQINTHERDLVDLYTSHALLDRAARFLEMREDVSDQESEDEARLIESLGVLKPSMGNRGLMQIRTPIMTMVNIESGAEYEVGPFNVVLDFQAQTVHINATGQRHPHIGTSGTPCWGNIGARVRHMLAEGRVGHLCVLLREFLESYDADNAYFRMEEEEEKEEEEEDREGCLEQSSHTDCVRCRDRDCPYQEDAETRCGEAHDEDTCKECEVSCSKRSSIFSDCYERSRIYVCLQCEHDQCPFHGPLDSERRLKCSIDLAGDLFRADTCANCDHFEECEHKHLPKEEKEEEEEKNEP